MKRTALENTVRQQQARIAYHEWRAGEILAGIRERVRLEWEATRALWWPMSNTQLLDDCVQNDSDLVTWPSDVEGRFAFRPYGARMVWLPPSDD